MKPNTGPALLLLAAMTLTVTVTGCGEKSTTPKAPATNPPSSAGNPITAPVDYLGAMNQAQKRAAAVADLTPLQQAIGAFHAGEDRAPSSLNELVVEGYLPRLPVPPRGMEFVYDPAARGQVALQPARVPAP